MVPTSSTLTGTARIRTTPPRLPCGLPRSGETTQPFNAAPRLSRIDVGDRNSCNAIRPGAPSLVTFGGNCLATSSNAFATSTSVTTSGAGCSSVAAQPGSGRAAGGLGSAGVIEPRSPGISRSTSCRNEVGTPTWPPRASVSVTWKSTGTFALNAGSVPRMIRWSAVDVPVVALTAGRASATLPASVPCAPTTMPTPAAPPTSPAVVRDAVCEVALPLWAVKSTFVVPTSPSTPVRKVALTFASNQSLPTLTWKFRPLPRNDSKFWFSAGAIWSTPRGVTPCRCGSRAATACSISGPPSTLVGMIVPSAAPSWKNDGRSRAGSTGVSDGGSVRVDSTPDDVSPIDASSTGATLSGTSLVEPTLPGDASTSGDGVLGPATSAGGAGRVGAGTAGAALTSPGVDRVPADDTERGAGTDVPGASSRVSGTAT